jgi:hypothetical protein
MTNGVFTAVDKSLYEPTPLMPVSASASKVGMRS